MPGDSEPDYDSIASGTVDEVKEAVEDRELDPDRLLDAEKDGKNRKTLIEWLSERIEDAVPEEVDVTPPETEARYVSMEMLPVQERTITFFGGLLLGIVLVTALVMGGVLGSGGNEGASQDAVQADATAYLDANKRTLLAGSPVPPDAASLTVSDISQLEGAELYEITVTLEATVQNQTLSQDSTMYTTGDGRYLLIGQLFDTSRPIADQTPTR